MGIDVENFNNRIKKIRERLKIKEWEEYYGERIYAELIMKEAKEKFPFNDIVMPDGFHEIILEGATNLDLFQSDFNIARLMLIGSLFSPRKYTLADDNNLPFERINGETATWCKVYQEIMGKGSMHLFEVDELSVKYVNRENLSAEEKRIISKRRVEKFSYEKTAKMQRELEKQISIVKRKIQCEKCDIKEIREKGNCKVCRSTQSQCLVCKEEKLKCFKCKKSKEKCEECSKKGAFDYNRDKDYFIANYKYSSSDFIENILLLDITLGASLSGVIYHHLRMAQENDILNCAKIIMILAKLKCYEMRNKLADVVFSYIEYTFFREDIIEKVENELQKIIPIINDAYIDILHIKWFNFLNYDMKEFDKAEILKYMVFENNLPISELSRIRYEEELMTDIAECNGIRLIPNEKSLEFYLLLIEEGGNLARIKKANQEKIENMYENDRRENMRIRTKSDKYLKIHQLVMIGQLYNEK